MCASYGVQSSAIDPHLQVMEINNHGKDVCVHDCREVGTFMSRLNHAQVHHCSPAVARRRVSHCHS